MCDNGEPNSLRLDLQKSLTLSLVAQGATKFKVHRYCAQQVYSRST
ncbi:hypothetical protein XIS1_1700097 [Xenorhabdus innexi]|uniref:Uncharacterized protein n=1 Tax=Xenorhabdus innexi TaxID=290109 RepID=A0A1N6MW25_9GAMM|nr:hypothetical protein XIS1_1700097 [Xenorhabdus innexi]